MNYDQVHYRHDSSIIAKNPSNGSVLGPIRHPSIAQGMIKNKS